MSFELQTNNMQKQKKEDEGQEKSQQHVVRKTMDARAPFLFTKKTSTDEAIENINFCFASQEIPQKRYEKLHV